MANNLKMSTFKILKHDTTNSVYIQDGELKFWFDLYITRDGDLSAEWNQYIFDLNNDYDVKIMEYQTAENFEKCFEAAEVYLIEKGLLKHDKKGNYILID